MMIVYGDITRYIKLVTIAQANPVTVDTPCCIRNLVMKTQRKSASEKQHCNSEHVINVHEW